MNKIAILIVILTLFACSNQPKEGTYNSSSQQEQTVHEQPTEKKSFFTQKQPKIDASSEEAFVGSLQKIKEKLSEEKNAKLDHALKYLMFSGLNLDEIGLLGLSKEIDSGKMQASFYAAVNGKTPDEIISFVDQKEREDAAKQLVSTEEEIKILEQKKAKATKQASILKKIVVSNAQFYWYESKSEYFSQSFPVIEFDVKNNTGIPLSRIFYHGVVQTPGRAIPWIKEDFNHKISGGLENGESKHLELNPNEYSEWSNREVKERKDTVFVVTVKNAKDANDKYLVDEFEGYDQERLDSLYQNKQKLEAKLSTQ